MRSVRAATPAVIVGALTVLMWGACGATPPTSTTQRPQASLAAGALQTPVASNERPVAPEKNPVGDIPDTQAFVTYQSAAGGYAVEAPEGWARTTSGTTVRFTDKLDGEAVALSQATTAPTAATTRNDLVAAVTAAGRAVQVSKVQDAQLPAGPAVLVTYTANSEPDTVTGKQVRLDEQAYFFFRSGTLVMLTLWAPLGADNVDQWQRIAHSFRWT